MSEDNNGESSTYEVGYKKPPKTNQFKKGQSGNPSGSSANRRRAKPAFCNPFQEKLAQCVEVTENGKTVRRSRKHLGVRRLVEAAAKGDMRALAELLNLRDAPDPSPSADDYFRMSLLASLAWAPPEFLLHQTDTIVVRNPGPGQEKLAHSSKKPPSAKRKSKRVTDEPRDQTWKSLINFEFSRIVAVMDKSTGAPRKMAMRGVILEQLATGFAMGKRGASKLAVRFNEMTSKDKRKKLIPVVYIPHDYVIPPKCDDRGGWPPGHPDHRSWAKHFPLLKSDSTETS